MYTYDDILMLDEILITSPNAGRLRDIINYGIESQDSAAEILSRMIQPYPICSKLDEFIFWTKIDDVPLWLSEISPEESGNDLLNNWYRILIMWRFKIGK